MIAATSPWIFVGNQARGTLARSLAVCANAVATSLGPEGRALLYEQPDGSIARATSGLIAVRRVMQNAGPHSIAQRLLEETLTRVEQDLGDGTARVALVAVSMFVEIARHLANGVSQRQLAKAIEALEQACGRAMLGRARSADHLASVAWSAAGDSQIAACMSSIDRVLFDADAVDVVSVAGAGVAVKELRGYRFEIAGDVVGRHPDEVGLQLVLHQPYLLVANEIVDDFGALLPILEQFVTRGKTLLIVARGFEGGARQAIVRNRHPLTLNLLAMTPREAGEHAVNSLEDLCIASGATLIDEQAGLSVATARPDQLAHANEAGLKGDALTLTGMQSDTVALARRRRHLFEEAASNGFLSLDRERCLRRATRLNLHWAEMEIGTDSKHGEARVHAANAALRAVRAASQSGIVDGAGRAMAEVAAQLGQTNLGAVEDMATMRAAVDVLGTGLRSVSAALRATHLPPPSGKLANAVVDPLSTTNSLIRYAVSLALTLSTVEALIC